MDIIQEFSGYLGAKFPLPRQIENASELQIARKYRSIDEHIGKLRSETMKYTFIDAKSGGVKTKDDSRLDDLQNQIQVEEARLQRIREIADEIGTTLSRYGAAGIYELHEIRAKHVNTIQSAPHEAWHLFKLARGEGHSGPEYRVSWLPSDLAQEPGYKAQEDRLRAGIATAKAALEPINADLQKLSALVTEAGSL